MTWEDVVSKVPASDYQKACDAAKQAARDPNYGSQRAAKHFDSPIPHDIAYEIWDSGGPEMVKLDLAIRAYSEMPCYGYAMYFSMNYNDLSSDGRDKFWKWMRFVLSEEIGDLANPLQYSLWCDFFEADTARATDAWNRLVDSDSSDKLLKRVLESSGPVPYRLKAELYRRLLPSPEWHESIFRSIEQSMNDIFGRIDFYEAKQIAKELVLPENTDGLPELRRYMRNVRKTTPPKGESR